MRNNFDHFDERLDRWWQESKHHVYLDLNLMRKAGTSGVDEIDRFRAFDATTTDLTFWGQEFNIQRLVDEVRKIAPRLEEAYKPRGQLSQDLRHRSLAIARMHPRGQVAPQRPHDYQATVGQTANKGPLPLSEVYKCE